MAEASKKSGGKPDLATLLGVFLALGGIVGGLLLEGGKLHDIAQLTAALIVLGGTMGAVMVSTPMRVILHAIKRLRHVVMDTESAPHLVIEEIILYASSARRKGLVSLEQDAASRADPFLRKALGLAVDGCDLGELKKMMELEIQVAEQHADLEAKVFENAGGYSPTIGIIGAVLGLIQVMKNLANIDEVGHGIAVAFVATVYGVALANLFLLPAANKIKARAHSEIQLNELMLEGVIAIVEGMNPKLIRSKLEAYSKSQAPTAKGSAALAGNKAAAEA